MYSIIFTLQVREKSDLEAVLKCSRREGETLADGILKVRVGEKCVVLTIIFLNFRSDKTFQLFITCE